MKRAIPIHKIIRQCLIVTPALLLGHTHAAASVPAHRSPYASQDCNWRARCKALTAGTDPSVVLDSGLIAVEYFDGLGRNVQRQGFGSGHGGFSAGSVDSRTYDWRGRVVEELLPAPVAVPGDFVGRQDLCALMQEPQACYSTTSYEANTFGRPVSLSRPGANKKRAGRAILTTYTHNSATKGAVLYCPRLLLQDNKIKAGKPWQAGDLAASVERDEDGETLYRFTDMRGRVILERRVSANGRREDTMYYYDHAGRLLHILPPAMSAKVSNGETVDLKTVDAGRMFSYRYDSRERPVEVQMPASGRVRTAFTPHSRQALWQDAVLSRQSRVLRTTYDNRNRRAYVSLHGAPDSLFNVLAVTSRVHYLGPAFKAHLGYTMPAGIKNANEEQILSVDYYDDYSFLSIYPEVADSLDWRTVPGCDMRASGAKHRLTGTARRIIGPTGITGKMQVTAYYYDVKGRLVQAVGTNIAGGFDRTALALSFDGRVTRSTHFHTAGGNATIRQREFVYDGQARLAQVRMKTNNRPWVTLTDTEYDPRGWVLVQRLLDEAVQVGYEYNDAGELMSIISAPFTQHLYRDEPTGQGGMAGRIPLYNGRISGETFSLNSTGDNTNVNVGTRSLNAGYAYIYEGLRLAGASYTEFSRKVTLPIGVRGGNIYTNPDYSVSMCYNADGMPAGIKRHGLVDTSISSSLPTGGGITLQGSCTEYKYGLVDDLALQYKAGQLDRVDDRADTDCALSIGTDFSEAVQRDGEYEYDACGRMTRDRNKGVSVSYNILGLPSEINCGALRIRYTYNSDGELLRTEYGTVTFVAPDPAYGSISPVRPIFNLTGERMKCGEVEYVDGKIERIWDEAGWGDAQGVHVAAVRDCRGSLRATYSQPAQAAPPALTATPLTKVYGNLTAYYPGGLPFADWQGTDRYLFSGKELERGGGLLTYDFHARRYDPQTLLFQQPDPCADAYPGLPAYLYCAANPVSLTDPSGCIIKGNNKSDLNEARDLFVEGLNVNKEKRKSISDLFVIDTEQMIFKEISLSDFFNTVQPMNLNIDQLYLSLSFVLAVNNKDFIHWVDFTKDGQEISNKGKELYNKYAGIENYEEVVNYYARHGTTIYDAKIVRQRGGGAISFPIAGGGYSLLNPGLSTKEGSMHLIHELLGHSVGFSIGLTGIPNNLFTIRVENCFNRLNNRPLNLGEDHDISPSENTSLHPLLFIK